MSIVRNRQKKQIKKDVTYPTYLKNGKINPAIIKQRKAISKTETIELSQTLASEKVEEINQTKCNMPHHTIIIYKNNSQSYIDLCFYCKKLNTSKDITLTEGVLMIINGKDWNPFLRSRV